MGHDCSKVLSKVFLSLDGEMSAEEEKVFLEELKQCSCCLDHFEIEKEFKNFLQHKVEKRCVKEDTVASIKSKIKSLTMA
jgi:polyhydroxyalkanoate synthesis regulator phasin